MKIGSHKGNPLTPFFVKTVILYNKKGISNLYFYFISIHLTTLHSIQTFAEAIPF